MRFNLARFDLVSIRLAVICADLGSLSAASRQVHCSLSTASYRLSILEQAVDVRLFKRDRLGMHLTPAGQIFVQHARAVLHGVEMMALLLTTKQELEQTLEGV